MSAGASSRLFRFGQFEADLENARLTRKGVSIRLQAQPFRILAMLLQNAGQVVTREDLQHELWPAGTYVTFDSSLNAALNRLRAALDDDADNPRFIETVPKRGYRFIAPVNVEVLHVPVEVNPQTLATGFSSPAAAARAAASPPASRSIFPKAGWVMAISAAAILMVAVAFLAFRKPSAATSVPANRRSVDIGSLRRSVAVLGFQNASGRPSDAWLSIALVEMLRTELGAGGKLRVVPGENVAQFRAGAPWSETDSLSPQTASRIGKALDSDLLVLGSFAALGDTQNRSVRVDFRLQDAQTGEILYEGAESGSEKQFFGLVATVGTDLRQRLGLPVISESEEAGVISALPSDPDANRFYSLGLAKLRAGDVAAAKDLLLQSEKFAPRFPLVHLMLYRAWAGLGYDQKAKDEVRIAYQLSSSLPDVDRLQIEGAYFENRKDFEKAVSAYRALHTLHPDSVDYAEQLIHTLNFVNRREEGLAIVKQLRELPPPASLDPRIDLWQGQLVSYSEGTGAQPFFEKAAIEAASRGQEPLYAHIRFEQCRNLVYGDRPEAGVAYCQEAYNIFLAAGNRLSAADALRIMADRRGAQGDFSGARQIYQQALGILRPLGEHEKAGAAMNNMAITYENQGQSAEAEKLFRQAAETWHECGDLVNEGVALGNVADSFLARGRLHEAEEGYQNARKGIEAAGGTYGYGYWSIATVRLYEGDISGANQYASQGLAISQGRHQTPEISTATAVLGDIRVAQGDLLAARGLYNQALAIRQQLGNRGLIAESQAALAVVSIEEGTFTDGETVLRKSLAEFQTENAVMDEISAETELSRTLLHEGRVADARQTISEAIALSSSSRDPNMTLPAAIMDARIQAAELAARANAPSKPDFAAPRRKLLDVVGTAHRLGYYGLECDARLASAELELRENSLSARAHLQQLARDAREHGLNLVSRKAAALAGSATASSNHVVSQLH